MVTLEMTMDDHSLIIRRNGKPIGHSMWHQGVPFVELDRGGWPDGQLTFTELETIMRRTNETRKQRGHCS